MLGRGEKFQSRGVSTQEGTGRDEKVFAFAILKEYVKEPCPHEYEAKATTALPIPSEASNRVIPYLTTVYEQGMKFGAVGEIFLNTTLRLINDPFPLHFLASVRPLKTSYPYEDQIKVE